MTIKYWRMDKNGVPIYKRRHVKNNLAGSFLTMYITLRYKHYEIESFGGPA